MATLVAPNGVRVEASEEAAKQLVSFDFKPAEDKKPATKRATRKKEQ